MGRLYDLLKILAMRQQQTFIAIPNTPGWYRIATVPVLNSWILMLSISKGYNTGNSDGALVAISGNWITARISTLLPARPVGHATGIKQLRVLVKANSPSYIDGYYDDDLAGYQNGIRFQVIGGLNAHATYSTPLQFEKSAVSAAIPSGYTAITKDITVAGGGIALPIERRWPHEVIRHIKAACWPGEVWRRLVASRGYPDTVGSGGDCIGSWWELRLRWREDDSILSQSVFRANVCVLLKQLYNVLGIGKYECFNNHLRDDSVYRNKRTNDIRKCSLVRHRQSLIGQEVAA